MRRESISNTKTKTLLAAFGSTRGGHAVYLRVPVKQTIALAKSARASRPFEAKDFILLFVTAWVCVGPLLKRDMGWLYALACLTVIAAFWVGRRQPALPRVLLLLVMVFPGCKKADRRDENATRGNTV